jgi:phenylacetate-CoA ligase
VLSRYNAVEAFKIGYFCEQRTGFHIHEDLCHVRIVGPDGGSAPAGQPGEVVISNLVNRAAVLLNYPIGDLASMSDEACSCGRTFRVLSELEGRREDILPLADGRFVHPRAVWQVFKDDREVLQYQLTQPEPRRFALRLVTVDDQAFRRVVDRALPRIEELLGGDAAIDVSLGSQLDRHEGGKFRVVGSLCDGPNGA